MIKTAGDHGMRRFELHRDEDETGVSGTGVVAEGVQFTDGTCALRWRSAHTSTAIYEDIAALEVIHGHGGRTRVVWIDPAALEDVQCPAVTVLTEPWEVVRCEANRGHGNQHRGHDSAGTLLLWREDAVFYADRDTSVSTAC